MQERIIISIKRKRGAEAYVGATDRDTALLKKYSGFAYFYRSDYESMLVYLGTTHGISLLVDEPFDEPGPHDAKPGTLPPGDIWKGC